MYKKRNSEWKGESYLHGTLIAHGTCEVDFGIIKIHTQKYESYFIKI